MITLSAAMVKSWFACGSPKVFCSVVRIWFPIVVRVWVAPYSLVVGGVFIFGCVVFGGMSPCCVMRPRYCFVIFWARCFSLFHVEVTEYR